MQIGYTARVNYYVNVDEKETKFVPMNNVYINEIYIKLIEYWHKEIACITDYLCFDYSNFCLIETLKLHPTMEQMRQF